METYYTDAQNYVTDKAGLESIEASLKSGAGATLTVTPGTATADTYTLDVTSKYGQSLPDGEGQQRGSSPVRAPAVSDKGSWCPLSLSW